MREAIADFNGVAHRLEFVREARGAKWYNDSIATAPERVIAEIHSFDEPLIVLLGGRDKKLPWGDLLKLLRDRQAKVFVFGEAGELIANYAAQENLQVTLCSKMADAIAAAAAGRRALALEADVSDFALAERHVATVAATFGRLDALVCCAGITDDGLSWRMTEAQWDRVLGVNLKGCFNWCRAAGAVMKDRRGGRIVNIASIIGLIGNAGQCNYAASKAGVIALTKSVARELASRNVRANAVAPGFIKTKMTEALPEDIQKKMLDAIPLGRFGEPEDVADVVLFLAGDSSAYVTGQTITVCGGMVTA